MLTVVCVLRNGPDFTPDYVIRLRNMVERNLDKPHRFVCLSDVDVPGVERIPLKTDWPGWWAKLEIFAQAFEDRALYFDLDVLITGPIAELGFSPEPIIFAPPGHVILGIAPKPKPGVVRAYQASVISWAPLVGREFYTRLTPPAMAEFRSDQDWIASINPNLPTFPPAWFRKLRQCRKGPPSGVKVVLSQRPELNDKAAELYPWVRRTWI